MKLFPEGNIITSNYCLINIHMVNMQRDSFGICTSRTINNHDEDYIEND